jgi:predicted transcriptional regulator
VTAPACEREGPHPCLASRAATAQSVIARIESGATSPSRDTLSRLVEAAGFVIDATLVVAPVKDDRLPREVERIRSLQPEARLAESASASAP